MTAFVLGPRILELKLRGFRPGRGWYYGVRTFDGSPLPAGVTITLELAGGTVSHDAEITADRALWSLTPADVAEILALTARDAALLYTDADGHIVTWAEGRL